MRAQLAAQEFSDTHSFQNTELELEILKLQQDTMPSAATAGPIITEASLSLFVMDHKKVLPLTGRSEYTLGRVAEGQPILPDVDLVDLKPMLMESPGFMPQ